MSKIDVQMLLRDSKYLCEDYKVVKAQFPQSVSNWLTEKAAAEADILRYKERDD